MTNEEKITLCKCQSHWRLCCSQLFWSGYKELW